MPRNKQKLELTWIGKENRPKLEPRVLIEEPEKSYHAAHRVSEDDLFDNKLIFGDNLLALKALEAEYSGKVKCIYIDPPYNTGAAFEHYDDNLENSVWLSLMAHRISILSKLVGDSGLLAIQIDDRQYARLWLILEEEFGQSNLKTICVKMSEPTGVKMASINQSGGIAKLKEYVILARRKGISGFDLERIPKGEWDAEYRLVCDGVSKDELGEVKAILESEDRTNRDLERIETIGRKMSIVTIPQFLSKYKIEAKIEDWRPANAWRILRDAALVGGARDLAVSRVTGKDKPKGPVFVIVTPRKKAYLLRSDFNPESSQPRCKILFADQYLSVHPGDLWTDIKTTGLEAEGGVAFTNGKKPEALVKRIIGMSTNPGDLVLDSFLGSGTTAAVAHKMGRRWIGIELGEHCHTHCIPRLQKVIDGEDPGGITKSVDWKGGGGFRYYRLAPSLIKEDQWGNPVINPEFEPERLAEAVCKIEGFTYAPSEEHYWRHGQASETDFIYVTTQSLSRPKLEEISEAVGADRSLLVCCAAFRVKPDAFPNLTLKKIPKAVLHRCEWDHDDYSLEIENLPEAPKPEGQQELDLES